MKAMLCVLAVVTLIAQSATGCKFTTNFDGALAKYSTIDTKSTVSYRAQLINADIPTKISRSYKRLDEINMYPDELPDSKLQNQHKTCKNFLGIELQGSETQLFCNISYFGLKIDMWNCPKCSITPETYNLKFFLHMEYDQMQPLRLEMPVLQMPEKIEKEDLEEWARTNKVGLLSPLDEDQLKAINDGKSILLRFDWLAKLLEFPLYDCDEHRRSAVKEHKEKNFRHLVSHPIVLPYDDMLLLVTR